MTSRLVIFVATLAPFVVFIALYWVSYPGWRHSRAGRMLMALAGSLAVVLIFAIVVQFADLPDDVTNYLRVVTLGGVSLAGWGLVSTLLLERRDARRTGCPQRRSTDKT